MLDQRIDQRHGVRLDDEFVMLCAEMPRHEPRIVRFVIRPIIEADGKRFDRLPRMFRHEADDRAGIDAAA